MLDKLKTKSVHLREAQIVFNTFIRLRDMGLPCIACGYPIKDGEHNASHYFPVGTYPGLRFEEDNCHDGCIQCNKHKGGNMQEYSINLPLRIGAERFEILKAKRGQRMQYSIPEIIELKTIYKSKIKSLKTLAKSIENRDI